MIHKSIIIKNCRFKDELTSTPILIMTSVVGDYLEDVSSNKSMISGNRAWRVAVGDGLVLNVLHLSQVMHIIYRLHHSEYGLAFCERLRKSKNQLSHLIASMEH